MKFPFLFKPTETTTSAAPAWPWPACVNNPKTLSFRAATTTNNGNNNIYKTMNSAYVHDKNAAETPDSFFSICDSFAHRHEESFSCASEICSETAVIRGMRSDRLFFEPGETSSILEEVKSYDDFPYKESAAIMAMDSRDPFTDFRVSMEEMVEAHGLKDWECLEELLTCYLRVNGKSNHGYIVGAFVDLLLHLAMSSSNDTCSSTSAIDEQYCSSSSTTTHYSFTSPLSFSSSTYSSTSPCFSLLENEDEIAAEKNHVDSPVRLQVFDEVPREKNCKKSVYSVVD
ncbi:Transcription repressor OFP13 [Sesamum alatum]|uniref:Transcription repressor n=1 Tax=Sesamum alatum TaxID=300844 RepID=A0AAE1XWJ4_9LAMI|nr:Transcription repressor OFP13 [Sesamum alatum]